MRVLLDTNVLVRVLLEPTGPAAKLLAFLDTPHVLVTSPYQLLELARVLRYPHLRARHQLSDSALDAFVVQLEQAATVVSPPETFQLPPVLTDPKDHPILVTVIAGQVEVLCTRDKHFRSPAALSFFAEHGVEIASDLDLLGRLQRGV